MNTPKNPCWRSPPAQHSTLWQTIGHCEKILLAVSALALMTGLIGILTVLLTALNERRREMAVLRAVGAYAYHVALLFILEAFLVVAVGSLFGIAMLYLLQIVIQPILSDSLGIYITISALDIEQIMILCGASMNRLVIHPDIQGRGLSKTFDDVRIAQAKEQQCKSIVAPISELTIPQRINSLVKRGFQAIACENQVLHDVLQIITPHVLRLD